MKLDSEPCTYCLTAVRHEDSCPVLLARMMICLTPQDEAVDNVVKALAERNKRIADLEALLDAERRQYADYRAQVARGETF